MNTAARPALYWQLPAETRRRAMEEGAVDSAEALGLQQIHRGRHLLRCLASGGSTREAATELGADLVACTPADFYDAVTALVFAAGFEDVDLGRLLFDALTRAAGKCEAIDSQQIECGHRLLCGLAEEVAVWPPIARSSNTAAVELGATPASHSQADFHVAVTALYASARVEGVDLSDLTFVALRQYNDCVELARDRAARRQRAIEVEGIWRATS